ncbi:klaroid protein-like [Phymastichus coffea]|uniref:klaroid protein-like n=1 Tax=Phymastichus coffea TaxID=108790 RepID=UPI00273B1C70|nr:klaroid protein-like [Phymastichus coffea]
MVYLTRKNLKKVTSDNLILMESLILFDIWLTMKLRWLLVQVFQLIIPLVKIASIVCISILAILYVKEDGNLAQLTDEKNHLIIDRFSMPYKKSIVGIESCNNYIYQYFKNKALPDFASEASGALIVGTPDTKTYNEPKSLQLTVLGLPVWKAGYYTPRKVIQSWTEAGECWAFEGSQGKIIIEMAYEIVIEKVTLEHIPVSAALTGKIDSAPKSFKVWSKVSDEFVDIGTFTYDDKGLHSQTFEIKKIDMQTVPIKIVMLEILSNYGNSYYTCIYRFRIHGKIYSLSKE